MTEIGFVGSGSTFSEKDVGKGAGLRVGITKIEFSAGRIISMGTTQELIGRFRTMRQKAAPEDVVRSFAFKCASKCTIRWKETNFDYKLLNEWVIFKGIKVDQIIIKRSSSGISPDIFDY